MWLGLCRLIGSINIGGNFLFIYMAENKNITKKEVYQKLRFYSTEITKVKPSFDTVFRIYYDSLKLISEIMYHVDENPWHPDNDYSSEIFLSISERFDKLEELRIKSIPIYD